jgi:hypothetical protein
MKDQNNLQEVEHHRRDQMRGFLHELLGSTSEVDYPFHAIHM